jgi:hypothetical protein
MIGLCVRARAAGPACVFRRRAAATRACRPARVWWERAARMRRVTGRDPARKNGIIRRGRWHASERARETSVATSPSRRELARCVREAGPGEPLEGPVAVLACFGSASLPLVQKKLVPPSSPDRRRDRIGRFLVAYHHVQDGLFSAAYQSTCHGHVPLKLGKGVASMDSSIRHTRV